MANPQPEEFAETITWRPDQGEHPTTLDDVTLRRVGVVEGAYGAYPVLEVEQDDGIVWAFHCFRDMAREELLNLRPQVGDRISIHYGGQSEKGYYRYRIRSLDGKRAEIDWSRFRSDTPAAAEQPRQHEQPELSPVAQPASAPAGSPAAEPGSAPAGEPTADDDIPF
jgi:hypothetical protein